MNCLENENVCSVKKEETSGYYRLHTIWRKDGFFINIMSKNGAWRGEMTPNDVVNMSFQLGMEPQHYLNLCKEVLTCHGGQPGFVYAVEDGCFAWKKVDDEDSGIKIKMGSVMLEPTNFIDTIQNLVTAALNCNKNLQEKLNETTEKKKKILESKNDLLNKLNELIKVKEAMESDLYSRFVLLINSKKKKIQELENFLEEKIKKTRNVKSENVENPYDIDTENDSEEEEEEVQKFKTRKVGSNRERNTKKDCAFLQEISEDKKIKNYNEGPVNKKINIGSFSYSCEPSTSKLESEKDIHHLTLDNSNTKDELYNYFYGEI